MSVAETYWVPLDRAIAAVLRDLNRRHHPGQDFPDFLSHALTSVAEAHLEREVPSEPSPIPQKESSPYAQSASSAQPASSSKRAG